MEKQQYISEADLNEEVVRRIDSSKLSINSKKNDHSPPKNENDSEVSSYTSTYIVNGDETDSYVDDNVVRTFTSSIQIIECSSPTVDDKEITMSHLVQNKYQVPMELSDHTYAKPVDLNLEDSGMSDDSKSEAEDDYMIKMEKFIKDFDRSCVELFRPKREDPDVSLELINLSVSSEENDNRNDRIEAMMSWNLDETKKFHTLDGENDQGFESPIRKPGLVHILSENRLLEKAANQLRTELKQFLAEFDLKTETFKSSRRGRQNLNSSSNYFDGKFGKTALVQTTKGPKMGVLEIIENSRRSRRKPFRNSNTKQQIVPIKKHFDKDGFCIRIHHHDEALTVLSGDLNSKDRMLREIVASFLKTFSKSSRFLGDLIPIGAIEGGDIADKQDELCEEKQASIISTSEEESDVRIDLDRSSRTKQKASYSPTKSPQARGTLFPHPVESYFIRINESSEETNLSIRHIEASNPSTAEELSYPLQSEDTSKVSKTCDSNILTEVLGVLSESSVDIEHSHLSSKMDNGATHSNVGNTQEIKDEGGSNPSTVDKISNLQDTPTIQPHPEEVSCSGIDIAEGSIGREIQNVLNIQSLPVGDNQPIYDKSLSVPEEICTNLQSTCLYFDERKDVDELATVVFQKEKDINDELEKLGDYEDFVNPLLYNARKMSENNQTC